jgi:glycosyltransferase involved in cell wall biosynthesis
VIGADEAGHEAEIKARVESRGLTGAVTFGGPRYGDEKVAVMQAADLFVLPTHSENFGIVVAEALACGVPVITTKGAPWEELEKSVNALMPECVNGNALMPECDSEKCVNALMRYCVNKAITQSGNQAFPQSGNQAFHAERAGWWIDIGVDPLAKALEEAMSLTDEERRAMGENGRRLVEAKYPWPRIADEMEKVYEKCVNALMPKCVNKAIRHSRNKAFPQ